MSIGLYVKRGVRSYYLAPVAIGVLKRIQTTRTQTFAARFLILRWWFRTAIVLFDCADISRSVFFIDSARHP